MNLDVDNEERIDRFIAENKPTPYNRKVSRLYLFHLLNQKPKFKLFCNHKWVRWMYGATNRPHRVCEICFKKQKQKFTESGKMKWVKDKPV